MNDTEGNLPPLEPAVALARHRGNTMSPALRIMLDDRLMERSKEIARYMSKAEGMIPRHLINKPEACFAVLMRSLTWKLDPYAVAQCTYQTPNGNVGFEGKLCQAILENSGRLTGNVKYSHVGDWDKLVGKFEIKTSPKGGQYPAPTWNKTDATGLSVVVHAQVIGEVEERAWEFKLVQAFPLNSPLWATDPKSQICYAAVRRFANLAAPGLFMGVPFDRDDLDPALMARDVTPRPVAPGSTTTPSGRSGAPPPVVTDVEEEEGNFHVTQVDHSVISHVSHEDAAANLTKEIAAAAGISEDQLEALWEANALLMTTLREAGHDAYADHVKGNYEASLRVLADRRRAAAEAAAKKPEPVKPEAKKAETAKPAPQAEERSLDEPTPHPGPAAADPAAVAPKAPATPPQETRRAAQPKPMKSPLASRKADEWPAWVKWFLEAIVYCPKADIQALWDRYEAEIAFCEENRKADHAEIVEFFEKRRVPV